MRIRLEPVTNIEQQAAAARVRREVFGTEWAIELCRIVPNDLARASQVIARTVPDGEVVATVTVLDTTGNRILHGKYELPFASKDRVARYTHLAVLKPYRGLNLPLYMLLEARQLYVIPGGFAYSWLLFEAARALSSTFCRTLGFSASTRVVDGEQGRSRVLSRDEKSRDADVADMQARWFLNSVQPKLLEVVSKPEAASVAAAASGSSSHWFGLVGEDQWIAR